MSLSPEELIDVLESQEFAIPKSLEFGKEYVQTLAGGNLRLNLRTYAGSASVWLTLTCRGNKCEVYQFYKTLAAAKKDLKRGVVNAWMIQKLMDPARQEAYLEREACRNARLDLRKHYAQEWRQEFLSRNWQDLARSWQDESIWDSAGTYSLTMSKKTWARSSPRFDLVGKPTQVRLEIVKFGCAHDYVISLSCTGIPIKKRRIELGNVSPAKGEKKVAEQLLLLLDL